MRNHLKTILLTSPVKKNTIVISAMYGFNLFQNFQLLPFKIFLWQLSHRKCKKNQEDIYFVNT